MIRDTVAIAQLTHNTDTNRLRDQGILRHLKKANIDYLVNATRSSLQLPDVHRLTHVPRLTPLVACIYLSSLV